MSKPDYKAVNVAHELERLGCEYTEIDRQSVRLRCPRPDHKDENPSASMNMETGEWFCHRCQYGASIVAFLSFSLETKREIIIADLTSRYPELEQEKTIPTERIEHFHEKFLEYEGPLKEELAKRGVDDELIRSARLGFYDNRISIPVWDSRGRCVNVRYYLPGAPEYKFKSPRGYGGAKLYQVDQIGKYEKIWLCGGELKALVAKRLLNPAQIGAISVSGGEGAWQVKWNALLEGKHLYVCMDIDAAGKRATDKIARLVSSSVKSVHVVELPLDISQFPKGDLNDFVSSTKPTMEDMLALMESARRFEFKLPTHEKVSDDAQQVAIEDAVKPEFVSKRVAFSGIVTGFYETPFFVPEKTEVFCNKNQSGCQWCTVFCEEQNDDGGVMMTIPSVSKGILGIVNAPDKNKHMAISESLGIPPCKSAKFAERSMYSIHEVLLSPKLTIEHSTSTNARSFPGFIVNKSITSNVPYSMRGVVYAHPKDQRATFLVDDTKESVDSLESFSPNRDMLEQLKCFQPANWDADGIHSRLDELYDDLSYNVTGIFGRHDMHLLVDLAYHSALVFKFENKKLRGWANVALVGDSGQGKTAVTQGLKDFYGLGDRVVCKNSTIAGLVGGLQQIGSRWFVSWGVVPQQDRRLVILEEVKGMKVEDISRLTDMRSSGVAEIPKIERGKANARTRLIFVSNPRTSKSITSYSFGVLALQELIGSLEDLRRFDVAMLVSDTQVSLTDINIPHDKRSVHEHKFTDKLCRNLVLFAWTRTVDQIEFTQDAQGQVREQTQRLCSKFSDRLPLLDRGTTHEKLARLAVSLAARTFSVVDKSPDKLLVRACHVQYIARYIERLYSDSVFGYLDYSQSQVRADKISDRTLVEDHFKNSPYPADIVEGLIRESYIQPEDIMNLYGTDKDMAQNVLSLLVRKHCVYRHRKHFVKTEDFNQLLRGLQASGELGSPGDASGTADSNGYDDM